MKEYILKETENSAKPMLKAGCELTVKHEVIGASGAIIFKEGEKVKVRELEVKEAFYGKKTGVYYPKEITGVKLEGKYGIWFPNMFQETEAAYRNK